MKLFEGEVKDTEGNTYLLRQTLESEDSPEPPEPPEQPDDPRTPQQVIADGKPVILDLRTRPNAVIRVLEPSVVTTPVIHAGHGGAIYVLGEGLSLSEAWKPAKGQSRAIPDKAVLSYYQATANKLAVTVWEFEDD